MNKKSTIEKWGRPFLKPHTNISVKTPQVNYAAALKFLTPKNVVNFFVI